MRRADHYAALDGLRGVAALSVVAYHLGHWIGFPWLATNSGYAVDFFFCLSGFVVGVAYDDKLRKGMMTSEFIKVRLIRLMPMIVFAVVLSFTYMLMRIRVQHETVGLDAIVLSLVLGLLNLPYLNAPDSVGGPQVFPLNGPQYTLFLELAANFLWVAIRPLNGLVVCLALAVASYLTMLLLGGPGGDTTATFWQGFPRIGASFFLGVALFHLDKTVFARLKSRLVWGVIFLAAAIAMPVFFFYPVELLQVGVWFWIPVVCPLLVIAGAKITLPKRVRSLALWAGAISYPIYALHYAIFCWSNGVFQTVTRQKGLLIEVPIVFAIIVIASHLLMRVVDEPVRAFLTRRLIPRPPRHAAPAAT